MRLFFAGYSLWVISTCVQAHAHTHTHTHTHTEAIPPADWWWRPPGHNQSGPGVKIIVSLVWWRRLTEGLARQEEGLSWTWFSHTYRAWTPLKCIHLFIESPRETCQALGHNGCGHCVTSAEIWSVLFKPFHSQGAMSTALMCYKGNSSDQEGILMVQHRWDFTSDRMHSFEVLYLFTLQITYW